MSIITRTNGEPYATHNAAAQQMSAKGLNDTHEVVEHAGGYAIAPKQQEAEQNEERVTLQPGDYVSTKGMTEDQYHTVAKAFMAAGAVDRGDAGYSRLGGDANILFWDSRDGELWHTQGLKGGATGCDLTIAQVLGATNAQPADDQGWIEWHGGECPVERGTLVDAKDADGFVWRGKEALSSGALDNKFWKHEGSRSNNIIAYRLHKQEGQHTMTTIDNLKAKRQARDEAETAYQDALRAVRAELGDGFTLEDNAAQAGALRDLPPEEWREGDVLECITNSRTFITRDKLYRLRGFASDGDVEVLDDDGDEGEYRPSEFRFHHRPA